MARYSIDGQILTDIADAVRDKVGETKSAIGEAIYDYSYTSSNDVYAVSDFAVSFTVPEAKNIIVRNINAYNPENKGGVSVKIASGVYTTYASMPTDYYYQGKASFPVEEELYFPNTDTITFGRGQEGGGMYYTPLNISATVIGLDENDEILVNKPIQVPRVMTPEQMATEISDMAIVPDEAFHITGDCNVRFANGTMDWLANLYGDRITTADITNAYSMFSGSQVEEIPFELNCKKDGSVNLEYMFRNCQRLMEIPKINYAIPSGMGNIFYDCRNLRYLPEDIETWFDWSYTDEATGAYSGGKRGGGIVAYCYSLRSIPMGFLNHNNPYATSTNCLFYNLFNTCYTLDEVVGLPIFSAEKMTWTSNNFNRSFDNCYRLKNMTFATNPDGSPIQVNWKSQTIDLSSAVGYTGHTTYTKYIVDYNSGITADKEVKDDATYQALKNDPDWFTNIMEYSRYNHDSAVATINSLPDTSAYGTNTIKFKGASGSATDGGAINTLTEEEIAVATAKGWTVSLV